MTVNELYARLEIMLRSGHGHLPAVVMLDVGFDGSTYTITREIRCVQHGTRPEGAPMVAVEGQDAGQD
jgi:hypothetical protein